VIDVSQARSSWLTAGQQMLCSGGAASIKLIPLSETAQKTSGSFYHHYSGMPEFLIDLARTYGTANAAAAIERASDPDPAVRLKQLHRVLQDDDLRPLDEAMRDWAGSDPEAAESVEAFDTAMLAFIEAAFKDLGYNRSERRARALLMFSISVARMNPPWRGAGRSIDEALALLTEPGPEAAPTGRARPAQA
jgi:hypothetical protein